MTRSTLLAHQAACRACRTCVDDGIIPEANPTFEGQWGAPFMLVGQAPGPTEKVSRRPFSGRAGKELDRWMVRAGFASAEEFRRFTYIAALMRCFPGRNATGSGDLRPQSAAISNCAHWLDAELRILKPQVLIPVGQMAINRILGSGPLEDRVGKRFGERPVVVPLPHPSGTSRWLNDPANRARLAVALELIADLRLRHAPPAKKMSPVPRATGSLTGHPARLTQRLVDKERKA
ncbi:MAG: uracil-DNA glycosylase family protein [Candidatus Dormiibacterota bacterium]